MMKNHLLRSLCIAVLVTLNVSFTQAQSEDVLHVSTLAVENLVYATIDISNVIRSPFITTDVIPIHKNQNLFLNIYSNTTSPDGAVIPQVVIGSNSVEPILVQCDMGVSSLANFYSTLWKPMRLGEGTLMLNLFSASEPLGQLIGVIEVPIIVIE